MRFKEGCGWKACYDEETGRYTAKRGGCGYFYLYEITEEIFEQLEDGLDGTDAYHLINEGRTLYMDIDAQGAIIKEKNKPEIVNPKLANIKNNSSLYCLYIIIIANI